MTTRRPPVQAARLLKRLFPRHDFDALLGDLHEEHQRGRSRLWYFAQILAAIVVASWKDIREHRALALRATLVGVASGVATLVAYFLALTWFYRAIEYVHSGVLIGDHWIKWPDRWMPRGSLLMVMDQWFVLHAAFLTSGWLVYRLHRSSGVSLLLPYAGLIALLLSYVTYSGPTYDAYKLLLHSQAVTAPISMLIGGLCATRRVEAA